MIDEKVGEVKDGKIKLVDKKWLPIKDVAKRLNVSDKHIYTLMSEKAISFIKIGMACRIAEDDLALYCGEHYSALHQKTDSNIEILGKTLLTMKEVAEKMGVSDKYVYKLKSKGEIPFVKIRHAYRILENDLETYLKKPHKILFLHDKIYFSSLHIARRNAHVALRRALRVGAIIGDLDEIEEVYRIATEEPNAQCYICGGFPPIGRRDVDHVIPLSRWGKHTALNLAITCDICNQRKHVKMPEEIDIYDKHIVVRARQDHDGGIMQGTLT